MKRAVIFLTVALFLLAACGNQASIPQSEQNTPQGEQVAVPPEQTTSEHPGAGSTFESSECYKIIKSTIETSFDALSPHISYNDQEGLIQVLFAAPDGAANAMVMNKNAIRSDWKDLCDNLNAVSQAAYEACISEGYKVGCTVMILSDANPDNVLFATLNGEVFYNAIDE